MSETKKSYSLKKNCTNRSNPNCIGVVCFDSDCIL